METYSSCCVQGSAGFWSSYRSPTDPERGGQLFGLSEVVYNWLQGGNKDGGAVYSQDAACCCSDCGQGYGFGEDRALCIRIFKCLLYQRVGSQPFNIGCL